VRELLVSAADIVPDSAGKTLTVRIHRMACPAHDKALDALLETLTKAEFRHPETGAKMVYTLA
jgi:mRNA-degrading endonuclease HigB of HigAB toxin-antitoxin module